MTSNSYLALCKNPVRFDPVTAVNNVFFDESNKQIFAVRSGGATGVIVRGPDDKTSHSFRLVDKGPLISIKFSYRHKILALQRTDTSIEFANIEDGSPDPSEYSQSSKGKKNKIQTFHWISTNEIVLVTKEGIEFYQINSDKRQVKLLKNYNFQINWSIFLPESAVLLCSTASRGIWPFHFKSSQVYKLPKFDVDRPVTSTNESRAELYERDVTMVNLYGNLYVAVLRHPSSATDTGTEVNLYFLNREHPAKKVYTLITGMTGRFAISVVDSLVIVHHQASKSSMIFDIKLSGRPRNSVVYLHPVIQPLPIRSHKLQASEYGLNVQSESETECQLYAPTWIVFQPSIIIDAALGCMWFLQIKLDAISAIFKDTPKLFDFLLLRRGSKAVILKVLKKLLLSDDSKLSFNEIPILFDKLNKVLKDYTEAEQAYLIMRKQEAASGSSSSSVNLYPPHRMQVVVDESEIYTHVLSVMARHNGIDQVYVCQIVVEYIRSLSDHKLPINHYFYELIIDALVKSCNFHQLEQYIHYNLIADSRIVATHLLTLESSHPPIHRIALDMFKRLSTSNDEVVDILLAKRKILEAIRYVKSVSMQDTVSARKFLESAQESNDNMLFYETFKFFEARNMRLRKRVEFNPGEQCDKFVTYYEELFGDFAVPVNR